MFADTLAADLRLAVRRLVQRPGFSALAVATLALGLGANVALFTLIEATMYQRLPVARPDELVRLGDSDTCCVNSGLQTKYALFSYDAYRHLRDRVPELASLAAFQASSQTIGIRRIGAAITESVPGEFVSGNYFATLGVAAAAGRLLDASDDRRGATNIEPMLRQALADIDPDLTVRRILPMSTQVALNFRLNRLMARLTAAYGVLALLVAGIGLYGVTAYAVARRTREIGVRMALGANRLRVVLEIVLEAAAQTGIGLLLGLPLALAAAGTLASLLFEVKPRDPLVFAQAAFVLASSALVAAFIPARRAASIDPARALRSE